MSSKKTSFYEYFIIMMIVLAVSRFVHNCSDSKKDLYCGRQTDQSEKTVKIDAGSGGTYYDMGIIYGKSDLYEQAIGDFQEIKKLKAVLKTNPDDVAAHYNFGEIYTKRGLQDKAIKEYKEVLRIEPEHIKANLGLKLVPSRKDSPKKEKKLIIVDKKVTKKKKNKKYIITLVLVFVGIIFFSLKKLLHKKTIEEYKKIIYFIK